MSKAPLPTLRGVGALLFAVGLVTATVGGGVLGPGAQQTFNDVTDDLNPVGEVRACGGLCVGGAVVSGIIIGETAHRAYDWWTGDSTDGTYTEVSKQETMESVESHAGTIADDQEPFHATMSNQLGDGSTTVAWTKMKAEVIKAMNNGTSEANATKLGKQAVNDYYASMQVNMLRQYNRSIKKTEYLKGVWTGHSDLSDSPWTNENGHTHLGYVMLNATLANGSTVLIKAPRVDGGSSKGVSSPIPTQNATSPDGYNVWGALDFQLRSTEHTDKRTIVEFTKYSTLFSDSLSYRDQMTNNAELYVSNLYDQYNAGDINVSDVADPTTLAQEFATDYNSTGHYAYAGAELALMGVETDLNKTFTVETQSGKTLSGALYTSWKPDATNGSLVTDHQYDPMNATDGPATVMFATNDGVRTIREKFTITEMRDYTTGETVEKTVTHTYNRQTSNVSVTQEQIDQLIELQQKLAEQEANAATGGGGGWDFGGFGNLGAMPAGALVAAAGAAVVLLGRN